MRRLDRRGSLPGLQLTRWLCGATQSNGRPCRAVVAALQSEDNGRHLYVRHTTEGPAAAAWTDWHVDDPMSPPVHHPAWCPRHGELDAIDTDAALLITTRQKNPVVMTPTA